MHNGRCGRGPAEVWHYKEGKWERGPAPAPWVDRGAEPLGETHSPWEGYSRVVDLVVEPAPLSFAVDEQLSGTAERWVFEVRLAGVRSYFVVVDRLPDYLDLLSRLTATANAIRRCEADDRAEMS